MKIYRSKDNLGCPGVRVSKNLYFDFYQIAVPDKTQTSKELEDWGSRYTNAWRMFLRYRKWAFSIGPRGIHRRF